VIALPPNRSRRSLAITGRTSGERH
jgi:hypothetical protein